MVERRIGGGGKLLGFVKGKFFVMRLFEKQKSGVVNA